MSHKLYSEELLNFESKTQLAGSFGNGENKSLNIVTKVGMNGDIFSKFTVENHRNEVFSSENLGAAIIHYNML